MQPRHSLRQPGAAILLFVDFGPKASMVCFSAEKVVCESRIMSPCMDENIPGIKTKNVSSSVSPIAQNESR